MALSSSTKVTYESTTSTATTTAPTASATTTTSSEPRCHRNKLHSLSNEVLPPVLPPIGIDLDVWEAFYVEFGHLLSLSMTAAVEDAGSIGRPNDGALIWSNDGGSAELRSRRESRARRATEALANSTTSAMSEEGTGDDDE